MYTDVGPSPNLSIKTRAIPGPSRFHRFQAFQRDRLITKRYENACVTEDINFCYVFGETKTEVFENTFRVDGRGSQFSEFGRLRVNIARVKLESTKRAFFIKGQIFLIIVCEF